MSRNGSGVYSLPSSVNPVVPGTTITDEWANTTLEDLRQGVTDSLDRNGRGGMLAPMKVMDGNGSVPGLSFTNESSSGLWRPSAGVAAFSVLGTEIYRVTNTVFTITGSLSVSGGITGNVTGNVTGSAGTAGYITNSAYNGYGARTVSTSAPSGGVDGDVWYRY